MKRLLLAIPFFISFSVGYCQNLADCKFTIDASDKLYNNSYQLFRYSIRNVTQQNDADKISKLLDLRVGDNLIINKDSLCNRLAPILTYKKYYLSNVSIRIDSVSDLSYKHINIQFEFSK